MLFSVVLIVWHFARRMSHYLCLSLAFVVFSLVYPQPLMDAVVLCCVKAIASTIITLTVTLCTTVGQTIGSWQASLAERKPPLAVGADQAAQDWRQEQLDIGKYGLCAQVAGVSAACAALMSLLMPSPLESKERDYTAVGVQVVALMVSAGAAIRTARFLTSLDERKWVCEKREF